LISEEAAGILETGLLEDWKTSPHVSTKKLENSLSVTAAPLTSWAQRKIFQPSK
jgi:hypothetical protein